MISPRASAIVGRDPLLSEVSAVLAAVESQIKSRGHAERVAEALELYKDPELGRGERTERDLAFTIADPWCTLVRWFLGDWLIASGLAEEQVSSGEDDPRADIKSRHRCPRLAPQGRPRRRLVRHQHQLYRGGPLDGGGGCQQDRAAGRRGSVSARACSARQIRRWGGNGRDVGRRPGAFERWRQSNSSRQRSRRRPARAQDQELAGLRRELIVAEAELAGRRARLDLISSLRARGDGLDALPEVMASPHVADLWRQETELHRVEAQLRSMYGDDHPQVRAVLADKATLASKLDAASGRIVANLEHETKSI